MQATRDLPKKLYMLEALGLAAIPLMVFFVAPINVIANNTNEVGNLDRRLAVYGLLAVALVPVLVLLTVTWLLRGSRVIRLAVSAARFPFIFLSLTGLLLPLTGTAGQVDAYQIPINWNNLLLALILTGSIIYFLRGSAEKIALTSIMIFIIAVGLTGSIRVLSHQVNSTPFERLTTVSSASNIFVLSFDGLSRDVALEVVKGSDEYSQELRDFVLFDHVISTAPSTQASITSEMVGGIDLKAKYGTEEAMAEKLDKSQTIAAYLQNNGFDISIYGPYSVVFSDPDKTVLSGTVKKPAATEKAAQLASIFRLSAARLVSPTLAYGYNSMKTVTGWLLKLFPDEHVPDEHERMADELVVRTRNHHGAEWDIPNITSVRDYYAYVDGLRVGTSHPVAQFLHFLHTHFPVDFDETCEYRSDDAKWFEANQNREGVKAETRCAFRQFDLFLRKLRDLGIYDRSTIVLKSDHGQPIPYTDPNRMESFSIRGHALWGYARLTPWLAIKPPGSRQAAPARDSRPVVLSDLARTICMAATPSGPCTSFEGFDLLSPGSIPSDARYFVNLVTGPDATFQMDTHQSVSILRREPFFETLTNMLTSEMLDSAPPCETNIDLTKGTPFNNGLTAFRQWASWRDGETTYLKWVNPGCSASTSRVTLRVLSKNQDGGSIPVKFIIADKVVATRTMTDKELGEPISFTVPLPNNSEKDQTLTMVAGRSGATVTLEQLNLF